MAQNLAVNARRFKKEGWENVAEQEKPMAEQATSENRNKQLNWAIEMKIDVVIITRKREQKEGVL